jgi:hypothetical protein
VSIVTVFNDLAMREACLDRSIDAHRADAPEIEFIPVDNREQAFTTAGAALNHGAAKARHDYIAFVHQDVYLHSLVVLEQAAGLLADDESIGILGAVGPTADAQFVGQVRDRIFLLGDPVGTPTDVDTVDELLFMIPRRVLEQEPLPEDPDLAWHAYAVDYCLQVRARGLRACAVDVAVTHNSLTGNLARLEEAYQTIAAKHPGAMPVMTPQGRVGAEAKGRVHTGPLAAHRWRYRWLRESVDAHKGSRAAGGAPCVLADIRLDIDDLIAGLDETLLVISADQAGRFVEEEPGPLELPRLGRPVRLTSSPPATLAGAVPAQGPVLLTNLSLEDVRTASRHHAARRRVVGYWTSLGYWMLIDVAPEAFPASWRERRARPLGLAAA